MTTVGLNLIFLVPGHTGGLEIYARELIAAMAVLSPPDTRFIAFVNRETADEPGSWRDLGRTVVVPVRATRRTEWVRGEQQLLPRLAAREGIELMHSLGSTAPAWGRFRRIVTVHDLIYRHYPEAHAGVRSLGMRVLVPLAVRRSHRIIVDAEATRRDLVELLRVNPERIDVVPLGLGNPVGPEVAPERAVRDRLALADRRVLLSLSAKRPHKNVAALLDALALLDERPVLVVAGYTTAYEQTLRAQAHRLGLDEDVRWVGWLEPAEIEALWGITSAFAFPSLYEGFGLPVLEAMARGVPVVCSNASTLPEVAGDAALYFDPHDPRALADALARLLAGGADVERLRRAGRERAAQFTWERTARLTLESYRRALAP